MRRFLRRLKLTFLIWYGGLPHRSTRGLAAVTKSWRLAGETCAFCPARSQLTAAVGCGWHLTLLKRCARHARTCEQCRFEGP